MSNKPADIKTEKPLVTIITVGFMIFATFFGAGNLIFPPFLGVVGGHNWWVGFIAFVIGDVVLGILCLAASAKFPQVEVGIYYRPGRKFMLLVASLSTFLGACCLVMPRTGATTFEVAVRPLAPNFSPILFLAIFFVLATICTIRPSKVVDIIGKYLTPALLVVLVILFIAGLINGGSGVRAEELPTGYPNVFAFGLMEGYQTFDGSTGAMIAVIIITALQAKGIQGSNEQTKTIMKSGLIAAVCCVVVYLGLAVLGLFMSADPALLEMYGSEAGLDRTFLLNYIIASYLGKTGTWLMSIITALATFTSCVGCAGMSAQFFERATNGKLKYQYGVVAAMAISFIIAVLSYAGGSSGVEFILALALPLLMILYPITVALAVMNLFNVQIKNDNAYRAAVVMAGICGTINYFNIPGLAEALNGGWNFLAPYGFSWIIPTVVAAVIGNFIKYKGYEPRPYLRENADKDVVDVAAQKAI